MALRGLQVLAFSELLFLLFGIATVNSGGYLEPWDYLIFVQHFPPAVCVRWQIRQRIKICTFPENHWTIHGLWPKRYGRLGPSYCRTNKSFDLEELDILNDELEKWWPAIETYRDKESFLRHAWMKHGTCTAPVFNNQYEFFSQGLTWMKTHNIGTILEESGITPGALYSLRRIKYAITEHTKSRPIIYCYRYYNSETKRIDYLLIEVRLCFDKSLNTINCPTSGTDCKKGTLRY